MSLFFWLATKYSHIFLAGEKILVLFFWVATQYSPIFLLREKKLALFFWMATKYCPYLLLGMKILGLLFEHMEVYATFLCLNWDLASSFPSMDAIVSSSSVLIIWKRNENLCNHNFNRPVSLLMQISQLTIPWEFVLSFCQSINLSTRQIIWILVWFALGK